VARPRSLVFEFFVRKLPRDRGFLIAAGLEQVLEFLEALRFTPEELDWLAATGRFGKNLLDYLASLWFTGDIHAMPEGTVFFRRRTDPARHRRFARGAAHRDARDQSSAVPNDDRRQGGAHGACRAGQTPRRLRPAPRARRRGRTYGRPRELHRRLCLAPATVLADKRFGIPIFGTMAHSYVQIHDDESQAFENFARARPKNLILLIDTYDTEAAARKVVALAPQTRGGGHRGRRGASRQRRPDRAVEIGAAHPR